MWISCVESRWKIKVTKLYKGVFEVSTGVFLKLFLYLELGPASHMTSCLNTTNSDDCEDAIQESEQVYIDRELASGMPSL